MIGIKKWVNYFCEKEWEVKKGFICKLENIKEKN